MNHRVRIASGADGGWVVQLRFASWNLSYRVIDLLLEEHLPTVRAELCTGLTRPELAALRDRLRSHAADQRWSEGQLSARELHAMHAALLAVRTEFTSEAQFWEATGGEEGGFYREDASGLAAALHQAVIAAAEPGPSTPD